MGRFYAEEADNYGGQGGAGFFSLKNDKETAKVRFMYDSIDDVEGFAVHEIEIDGKKRYVDCKRAYNEPVDKCPFCRDSIPQKAKLFVPLYDIASDKVKIWERGKKFFNQIAQLCSRYAQDEPLCSHVFEIERSGKPGDQGTTYGIFDCAKEQDNTTLEDLPEMPVILGGLVLDKTPEEMEYYLKHNAFPSEDDDEPPMRGSRAVGRAERGSERSSEREEAPTRRTPSRRGGEDKF